MDWYFDGANPSGATALRRALGDYLRRHAAPGSDVAAAEVVVSELITNAAMHAPGPAWVHVDWSETRPRIEIHDLGPGFAMRSELPDAPDAIGGRGLFIANHLAERLEVAAKRAGGSRVTAVLDVPRPVERSHDPPPSPTPSLPAPEEAGEDGTFGRESFLRALVVEMARAVGTDQGPDRLEATVAQVGANIGARMEDEYRAARGIVGAMAPEQIADLLVRLKAAIDGDFYVISADERRIVLGNRACPFGPVVRHAPGLCRMTSSVFGGIGARNAGRASVVLEERIAVGDPECRVVVWLGDAAAPPGTAHEYGAATVSAG